LLIDLQLDVEPKNGATYLIYGRADRAAQFPRLDFGDADFTGASDSRSSPAGDVDGDGFADVIVTTPDGSLGVGRTNLYYGGPNRLQGTLAPDDADAIFASAVPWAPDVASNYWPLGTLGDLDHDGCDEFGLQTAYDDLAHGAGNLGLLKIFYGRAERFSGRYGVDAAAFTVSTAGMLDGAGSADVNGDGNLDLLTSSAPEFDGRGAVALFLGSGARWGGTVSTSSLAYTIAEGPLTSPDDLGSSFGSTLATGGDVNGDGFADVIFTAPTLASQSGGPPYKDPGSAYVLLGARL
jgi:hypothetical protein